MIAEKLWPIIKERIKTIIENNQNIIIEGCYILPKFVKDFEEKYSDQIISVFLGFSTNYIEKNFTSDIIKYRSVIETRNYPEERSIIQFISEHNDFRKNCIEYGVKYFEIDTDYEGEIKKIYDFIDRRISEISQLSNY